MIFVRIEVVNGVFCPVERLDLQHSELYRKGEVQYPGGEWRFGLLHRASMETGAQPFTATFIWLISC